YITNSYHVPVFEEIDAFTKLELESKFQALSPGGAISYCEVGDMTQNVDAVLKVIQFMYENIMYAEINTKSDYCMECGFDGEMTIQEDMTWKCPQCGNKDHDKMNIVRRTCGLNLQ
ncbi:MAG: anaerobic ribonucleoside-triphosphate reductase, partial [Bacteroidales bacterium]